jgi:hypothetical protein
MHSLVSRGCVPKSSGDLSGLVHLLPGLGPFSLPSPSGTPQGEDGPPSFGSPALSPPRTGALHRPTSDRIPRLPKGRRLHLHAPLPKIFGRSGHLPTPPRFLPRTSSHSGMTRSTFPSHNNPAVRLFPERLPPQGPQMLHRRIPVHHPHLLRTLHLGKPLTPGCPVPDDHCSTPRQPLSPSPAAPQRPPPPVPPRGSSTPESAPLTPSARISDAPSPIEATPLQNVPSRPRLSLPLPPP